MSKKNIVTIDNLGKKYKDQQVFNHLKLKVNQGEWVGIVGKNGSGKSTLAKLILGIENSSQGVIWLKGKKKESYTQKEWVQEIQLVTQYSRNALDPTKTIKKILCEPLQQFRLVHREKQQQTIKEMMSHCHLPEILLTKYPNQLSGGQYQRVCIALALLVQPSLLICDEATASLDKINELRIINLLKGYNTMSVIIISHDASLIKQVCNRSFFLETYT